MQTINQLQLKAIATLCSKLKITGEAKQMIVQAFSQGRVTSSKNLTYQEAKELISHLKSLDPDEKLAEKLRRTMISFAHEMKWYLPNTTKVDMKRLDGWCKQYGKYKKSLQNHTLSELPILITQFKHVFKHYLSNI